MAAPTVEKLPVAANEPDVLAVSPDVERTNSKSGGGAYSITEGKVLDEDTADIIAAEVEYSEEYYRKLLWKIDLWLLPVMWVSDKAPVGTTISCIIASN
jgi:hypothetical protein